MSLVTPQNVALVLGLKCMPKTFAELDELVGQGLPKESLRTSIDLVCSYPEDKKRLLNRIISEATYKRRKETLSSEDSERAERLARVFATALFVWGSNNEARLFLNSPHPMLCDKTPLGVSLSEIGARRGEELLRKLFYGIAA